MSKVIFRELLPHILCRLDSLDISRPILIAVKPHVLNGTGSKKEILENVVLYARNSSK